MTTISARILWSPCALPLSSFSARIVWWSVRSSTQLCCGPLAFRTRFLHAARLRADGTLLVALAVLQYPASLMLRFEHLQHAAVAPHGSGGLPGGGGRLWLPLRLAEALDVSHLAAGAHLVDGALDDIRLEVWRGLRGVPAPRGVNSGEGLAQTRRFLDARAPLEHVGMHPVGGNLPWLQAHAAVHEGGRVEVHMPR